MRAQENSFIATLKKKTEENRLLFLLLLPAILIRRLCFLTRGSAMAKILQQVKDRLPGSSIVVSVPHFCGKFELDVCSDILKRMLQGEVYEKELADVVLTRIDRKRDAIDCGANVGFFSVLMASVVSPGNRVLAIEPSPAARVRLRNNLRLNDLEDSVDVFAGAASNSTGSATLSSPCGKEEYSTLGSLVHPSIAGSRAAAVDVPIDTIDNLVNRFRLKPGFIKIDVEGHEYKVLDGARDTLRTHRPVILAEASDILLSSAGSSVESLLSLLGDLGYTARDSSGVEVKVANFNGDILAVPKDD